MNIRLIDFSSESARSIDSFASAGASSVELACGSGESHTYAIHFAPGGLIGPHPAGFDQLFLVVAGSGWISGTEGVRLTLGTNSGAFVPKGEVHAKGSETGMVAVMVQASQFSQPGNAESTRRDVSNAIARTASGAHDAPTAAALRPHMFRLVSMDHLVLRVVDLERMLHFYCTVLGCTVEKRQDDIGLIQLRAGSSLIDLIPVDGKLGSAGGAPPGKEGRNLDHVCLRVEPFVPEAILGQLSLHGFTASPVEQRYGAEGYGPSIYVADPEGNVIELKGLSDSSSNSG